MRLGNIVPDFACSTTQGDWPSFHEWIGDGWCVLFSHPADFTPVCTTEIGRLALKYEWFTQRDVKVATLSVDPVDSHNTWLKDVVAHCENGITIDFPIIADADRTISTKYGMLDPANLDDQPLPLKIRADFIIGPDKKLKLQLNYPSCVVHVGQHGRNLPRRRSSPVVGEVVDRQPRELAQQPRFHRHERLRLSAPHRDPRRTLTSTSRTCTRATCPGVSRSCDSSSRRICPRHRRAGCTIPFSF